VKVKKMKLRVEENWMRRLPPTMGLEVMEMVKENFSKVKIQIEWSSIQII